MEIKTMLAHCTKGIISFILSLFLTACFDGDNNKITFHNTSGMINYQDGKVQIIVPVGRWISKDGLVYFRQVYNANNNTDQDIAEVINLPTFDWLYRYPEDSQKVNNEYYLKQDTYVYYFKDKHHIYIGYPEVTRLVLVGNSVDYEVLGGAYLRVGKQIYFNGKQLAQADAETFKTQNVLRNKSEWPATIGLDKNAIYVNENPIISLNDFNNIFNSDNYLMSEQQVEQLRQRYFVVSDSHK